MKSNIRVVKIGGNVVNNKNSLMAFLKDFSKIEGPKILVHGGGREATMLSESLGIKTVMIDGRRVTDANTIDIVTMVYAGLVNKRIVSLLQSLGVDALGMSGADANVVCATQRSTSPIDYGYVGDINPTNIRVNFIKALLHGNIVPVFCAINHDGKGQLLNCNADSVAATIATAMVTVADTELIYCFEKNGVLADPSDDESFITHITADDYEKLRDEGIISKGMIPKIENSLNAVKTGVKSVWIKHSSNLLRAIGTEISL